MAGHVFTLGSIQLRPGHSGDSGYEFEFISVDGSVIGVNVDIEGYVSQASGGGGGGGGDSGQVSSFGTSLYYAQPPEGRLNIRLSGLQVRGETKTWSLDWNPDSHQADLTPSPLAVDACLTDTALQQALTDPQPLPASLAGKLIVYGRVVDDEKDPSPDNYGVFVVGLDGNDRQELGPGVWPALSPDGASAVYAWSGGLYMTDISSGQSYHIPNTNDSDYGPRWSPDGSRIAFIRTDDVNLYSINIDGSGLQKVTDANELEQLIGWSADGGSLYYGSMTRDGYLLKKKDLGSGIVHDLFSVSSKGLSVAVSPDEKWIVSIGKLAGDLHNGLHISRLDGSEHRLLASLDRWGAINPIWSANGQWLLFTITYLEHSPLEEIPVVFNVGTCKIFPLPLRGTVFDWSE